MSSDTKNYLLMNIDGVVSPLDGTIGEKTIDGITVRAPYANWYVPERVATFMYLLDISKNRKGAGGLLLETRWSSMWKEDSNHVNRELDIDPYSFIEFDGDDPEIDDGEWHKAAKLEEFVYEKRTNDNVIVIVDYFFSKDFIKFVEQFPNVRLVTTDPNEGLTIKETSLISSYLLEK